jgi:hypothetical protein
MPATDYLTQLDAALWTGLEAHTPWTDLVAANNRIKLCGAAKDPVKTTWNDADFPECTVSVTDATDSLFTLEETYRLRQSWNAATSVWKEDLTPTVRIDLVHRGLNLAEANPLILETMTALRKLGPALGLAWVFRAGPATMNTGRTAGRPAEYGNAGGTLRLVTNIVMPVVVRLPGASLLT